MLPILLKLKLATAAAAGLAAASSPGAVPADALVMTVVERAVAPVEVKLYDENLRVASTVGIVRYSAQAEQAGVADYLVLLAFISLSLAIFNLLPFLPLDGGHVFLIALEKVRGRMVSRAVFERVSVLGIMLMALMFVVGLQNDLSSILGSQPH